MHVRTIPDTFTEIALQYPEKTALELGNQRMTYREVNEKANQLAHYLIQQGVGTESLVPICLDRSFEMIIGLLAIMKAGGAYVPIDPAYPNERIAYILNDTNCKVAVTDQANHQLMQRLAHDISLVAIADELLSEMEVTAPVVNLVSNNLAYVIYTSGSTGTPKGVMVTHQNVLRLFFNDTQLFNFGATDVWAFFHSFCFDVSVWEMFGCLLFGSKLVIVPKQVAQNAGVFGKMLVDSQITMLHQTPSAFNILQLHLLTAPPPLSLKYIIFAGEALDPKQLNTWKQTYPDCKLVNMYGITEVGIYNTYQEITIAHTTSSKSLIGFPIATDYIYVLDENQLKVEVGTAGELYLGGDGVARAYLNLPELSTQRFIDDHFSEEPHARLYRSGDLGIQLQDGTFEYLGRLDDQVKLNGFRIELGEISSVISQYENIVQCLVLAKDTNIGEKKLVAYYQAEKQIDQQQLLKFLLQHLPEYMVPRNFVPIPAVPLTNNGKVDKRKLAAYKIERPALQSIFKKPKSDLEIILHQFWANYLEIEDIGVNDNFFELGGTSLLAQRLTAALKVELDLPLVVTKLYQNPTIASLALSIEKTKVKNKQNKSHHNLALSNDIAVIGMACRFPGADTIEEFWKLLIENRESTTFFAANEIDPSIAAALKDDPSYVSARGIIENVTQFDAAFFGINPKLAALMDPQQRIFLEIAWEALEQTGHLPDKHDYKTGVFAGFGTNTYYENNVLSHPDQIDGQGKLQVLTVNEKDYAASRTAYHLNLKGPAVSVNSACSTSLLAITQAVNSLRAHQCDIALAGAASVTSPINSGHLYQEGSMLSADGHCKPFDDNATGTVFSDGAGVVLLKRLEDAKKDGDTIFGVIKGVGINNDGYGKGSFTAPSSQGQSDAISCALADAGIEASAISYVEAHGTGTPIGDPIEFEGLVDAFGPQETNQYCAIGSVKSNFGHLTQAAGVAGVIKTCLALYHQKIPASLGYTVPNKHIDFENSPFFVNASLKDWTNEEKRNAGVSSFGVGGTNVHVVLQEYDNKVIKSDEDLNPVLLTWSANSALSKDKYAAELCNYIEANPTIPLADISYSLIKSRADFSHRKFAVAHTREELLTKLGSTSLSDSNILTAIPNDIVFTFPGQGAQYLNMGRQLYHQEAVYQQAVDECAVILTKYIQVDIRDVIFNENASTEATELLKNTKYTQPALFVTEYALAKLWISYGIAPTLLCGHSIGEYVAAHLAGVFSLEDGLKLIATRGTLISELPKGDMLSVRSSAEEVAALLFGDLEIAAKNSLKLVVVAGPSDQILALSKRLNEQEIANKPLFTSHAFHSSMMDPILDEFKAVVMSVHLSAPKIPIVSTVTGKLLSAAEAQDPLYWTLHLRKPVLFLDAIEFILSSTSAAFVEVGPGNVTSTLTKQIAANAKIPVKTVASLMLKEEEYSSFLNGLGQLWTYGFTPELTRLHQDQQRKFLHLPSYQFDKRPYWLDIPAKNVATTNIPTHVTELPLQEEQINSLLMRKNKLTTKVKEIIEDASGIEMAHIGLDENYLAIGLDSLLLTQLAISLKREFSLPITFRKLNEEYPTIATLVDFLDKNMPADPVQETPATATIAPQLNQPSFNYNPQLQRQASASPYQDSALGLIAQQLEILSKQVMLMQGSGQNFVSQAPAVIPTSVVPSPSPERAVTVDADLSAEEKTEIQKPFGATPRIEKTATTLHEKQEKFLVNLTAQYNKKTAKSKAYTGESRSYMADPRVVSGFKPVTKELVYPIVINKSKGSRLWDLDGNEYIDALNGFGSNMLGYQPDVIKNAMHNQIEEGYEVGPQHELAATVSKLICEFTGTDRAALCSTGSEAVLGCIRIARTVTGRSLIVAFAGSYHGIVDEVLVRGTKKLKSFPAAAGIMPEAVQNILVLDYGTPETLAIIKERGDEIAAVLVETIQSRRPEFVPIDFLKELRTITEENDTVLIFDEVITGFRFHPGGAQAIFGIKADLAAYGKVVGAGIPIGVIAGKSEYMDALDGGNWQYGDDSIPETGVTYFAGTFVRHPLALASAKASLSYMKEKGPALQQSLNEKGNYISAKLNEALEKRQLPMFIANYGSLWKLKYHQELPYSELLFVLLRQKGIHILDGFPCFMTEAISSNDIELIVDAFTESLDEMIEAGFFPSANENNPQFDPTAIVIDGNNPPVFGAKLGKDKEGNPAWFIADPEQEEKYLEVRIN